MFEKNLVEKKGIFKPQTEYSDQVALLKLYPGISPEILDMYYEKGYKAVYIEGFGLGGMPFLKNDFTGKGRRSYRERNAGACRKSVSL